jgi:serine/threonine-protein kinase SRPK3
MIWVMVNEWIDIKPSNIMVQIPDEKSCIEKYLAATASSIHIQDPHSEYQIIQSHNLRDYYFSEGFNLMDLRISLADWGIASWKNKHLIEWIQRDLLRSPEVFLGLPWDQSTDIWNLGALIPELIYKQKIFDGRSSEDGKYYIPPVISRRCIIC